MVSLLGKDNNPAVKTAQDWYVSDHLGKRRAKGAFAAINACFPASLGRLERDSHPWNSLQGTKCRMKRDKSMKAACQIDRCPRIPIRRRFALTNTPESSVLIHDSCTSDVAKEYSQLLVE